MIGKREYEIKVFENYSVDGESIDILKPNIKLKIIVDFFNYNFQRNKR